MPGESSGTAQLSRGLAIEYKAYARAFGDQRSAVILIIATCYYRQLGYKIFFDAEHGWEKGFKLMEKTPTGIEPQHVTYYIASWTSEVQLSDPPAQLTVLDAYGEHQVAVKPWSSD
jgi:hypothetical protein